MIEIGSWENERFCPRTKSIRIGKKISKEILLILTINPLKSLSCTFMQRPFILITNDDGIDAIGIRHLWECVHSFADVAIVAPSTEKSGSSLAINWKIPLHVRKVPWEFSDCAWSITGTPADCVKIATTMLFEKRPDLILSGINRGTNSGRTIFYSGTIGAAIEGTLKGIPSIALSYFEQKFPSKNVADPWVSAVARHFLQHPLPQGCLLNVNFPPNFEAQGAKGMRMARQGRRYCLEDPASRQHPDGSTYYWLGGRWSEDVEEPDSDVALLQKGYAAIVPIQIDDLTDYDLFRAQEKQIAELIDQAEKPSGR